MVKKYEECVMFLNKAFSLIPSHKMLEARKFIKTAIEIVDEESRKESKKLNQQDVPKKWTLDLNNKLQMNSPQQAKKMLNIIDSLIEKEKEVQEKTDNITLLD